MKAPATTNDLPGWLRTFVTDAMSLAMKQGLPTVEAIEVVTATAADLGRFTYGDSYLQALAQKVVDRAGQPLNETPLADYRYILSGLITPRSPGD